MGEMVKSLPTEGAEVTPSRRGAQAQGSETGTQVGAEAKQVVSQVADQAKDLVSHRVTERAGRSARDIVDVARALRQTRGQLGDNVAAPYVDKAADQLERFSRFLRDANPAEVVRDVERFARREPLLFLGGAFALGLLGARFLKSSAHHQESPWSHEDIGETRYRSSFQGEGSRREGQFQEREGQSSGYGAQGSFVQRGMQERWSKNQGQQTTSQGSPGHEGRTYSSMQGAAPQPGQASTGTNWQAGSPRPEPSGNIPGETKVGESKPAENKQPGARPRGAS